MHCVVCEQKRVDIISSLTLIVMLSSSDSLRHVQVLCAHTHTHANSCVDKPFTSHLCICPRKQQSKNTLGSGWCRRLLQLLRLLLFISNLQHLTYIHGTRSHDCINMSSVVLPECWPSFCCCKKKKSCVS